MITELLKMYFVSHGESLYQLQMPTSSLRAALDDEAILSLPCGHQIRCQVSVKMLELAAKDDMGNVRESCRSLEMLGPSS